MQTFIVIIVFDGHLLLPRKHVHADSLAQKPDYVRSFALKNLLLPFCTDESNRRTIDRKGNIFVSLSLFQTRQYMRFSLSLSLSQFDLIVSLSKIYNFSKILFISIQGSPIFFYVWIFYVWKFISLREKYNPCPSLCVPICFRVFFEQRATKSFLN